MQLEPNELKYVVNHGTGLYLKQILKNQLIDTVCLVVSFDESLKRTSAFDFGIRRTTELKIDIGTPRLLEHTTHEHLLNSVHEGLKIFDMAKMVQLLMDRPNVNLQFLNKLKE